MQEVLPSESNSRESQLNPLKNLVTWGLSFLCWASPFFGLGIFFPIGVLVLYPKNRKLRITAFLSISFQIFIIATHYPIDVAKLYLEETESFVLVTQMVVLAISFFLAVFETYLLELYVYFWSFIGLIFLFLEARFHIRKYGKLNLFQKKPIIKQKVTYFGKVQEDEEFNSKWADYEYQNIVRPRLREAELKPTSTSTNPKDGFLQTVFSVIIVWLIAIVWYFCLSYFFTLFLNPTALQEPIEIDPSGVIPKQSLLEAITKGESSLYLWFMILYSASSLLGRTGIPAILRRPFLSLYIHTKLSLKPTYDFFGDSFAKKKKFARVRELILPGWGHIYLQRYWKGFPILFTFLLILFFFVISIAFQLDLVFGVKFLSSFGLKPGIPDKEFVNHVDNIFYPIGLFVVLVFIYIFANSILSNSMKKDMEPIEDRGLQPGFANNLSLSILAHLILFAIILIIPITVQRQSSKKKQDMSKTHYQPEKMEYYFIDPDIPDEVKDLNGGVISGTETPSKNDGIKIPDNPVEDEGKVKGYVKRIKGKKLPKTYSNYISARMRGPENFMEYWKRAPQPYSCVVAYTITTEGDIIDIILVEGSAYPDQDELTLELIRSMSPVMPPPNVKGDVRVTELFWNGSIDPDAMPTPLQKDMVLHFDGRYMEEEF